MSVLSGRRVLVVEDDPLIGHQIESYLANAGCEVSGPHATITAASQAAATEAIDVAALDINISGRLSYPVGDILKARQIPFLWISAYGPEAEPPSHIDGPFLPKPFQEEELTSALSALVIAASSLTQNTR